MDSPALSCARNVTSATLSAWRDADLPAEELRSLTAHTADCAACQAHLSGFDEVARALRAQSDLNPADRVVTGVRARAIKRRAIRRSRAQLWGGLGALSAVAALILLFVYVFGPALGNGTPHLAYTTYHLSDSSYAILNIQPDRDGGFWFSEAQTIQDPNSSGFSEGNAKIGHITRSGHISEYPLPATDNFANPPFAGELSVAPDGSVWFVKLAGGLVHTALPHDEIVRMTPDGVMTNFALPPSPVQSPFVVPGITSALAVSPDGNLWFGVQVVKQAGANPSDTVLATRLARITPSGDITEFTLPSAINAASAASVLTEMVADRDGNVWFYAGDQSGSAIVFARATPSGTITTYTPSNRDSAPANLTLGPDGNVWFVDLPGGTSTITPVAIGRITPAGQITEFPVTTPNISFVFGLTPGRDGNLYFLEASSGCPQHCTQVNGGLGRITSAGKITLYPLRNHPNILLFGPEVAPDGSVYAVELDQIHKPVPIGTDRLVRLTSAGHFIEYAVPTHTGGTFLMLDGAGNTLWLVVSPPLSASGASTILHITLPA